METKEDEEVSINLLKERDDDDDDIKIPAERYISDVIKVDIIPEKRGVFLKHTEYRIESVNHKCSVDHRYSDFVNLYDNLLRNYEFRIVPRLPVKQFMLDAFLEERRIGLQRWLILLSQHPILSRDVIFKIFLTKNTVDYQNAHEDEFSQMEATIDLNKYGNFEEVLLKQEQMRRILNQILGLKRLIGQETKRRLNQRKDFGEISDTLSALMKSTNDNNLHDFTNHFATIFNDDEKCNTQNGVIERLELISEVVTAFNDLCDRIVSQRNHATEKGFNLNLRNIIKSNLSNNDEEIDKNAMQKKRSFGIYCVIEEFNFVQKYLKLLPSILLQFTFDESKNYSHISQVLHNIIEIESDKLN